MVAILQLDATRSGPVHPAVVEHWYAGAQQVDSQSGRRRVFHQQQPNDGPGSQSTGRFDHVPVEKAHVDQHDLAAGRSARLPRVHRQEPLVAQRIHNRSVSALSNCQDFSLLFSIRRRQFNTALFCNIYTIHFLIFYWLIIYIEISASFTFFTSTPWICCHPVLFVPFL